MKRPDINDLLKNPNAPIKPLSKKKIRRIKKEMTKYKEEVRSRTNIDWGKLNNTYIDL